jgi:hypothetical protein
VVDHQVAAAGQGYTALERLGDLLLDAIGLEQGLGAVVQVHLGQQLGRLLVEERHDRLMALGVVADEALAGVVEEVRHPSEMSTSLHQARA